MSKSVALHICCAICLVAPREELHSKGYKIQGVFFNPNIQPYDEYLKRLYTLKNYIKSNPIKSISSSKYNAFSHLDIYKTTNARRNEFCAKCYELRLRKAAITAKSNKIKHFSTTLLSSPFQDKLMIREIGAKLEKEFKLTFIDSNKWEKRHFESKKIIRNSGLYVQKYCGCIYSKMDMKARKSALINTIKSEPKKIS